MNDVTITNAGQYGLPELADIFTRSFEGYFYAGTTTADELAQRIRVEQIDLWASCVLLADDEPAGVALLARRASRVWCGGFGVYSAYRGRGYSHRLAAAMLDAARRVGGRSFELEVLTRNDRALRTYEQAGMRSRRELYVHRWDRADQEAVPATAELVDQAEPYELLQYFQALHPVPAAWQRDLPSLLVRENLRGLVFRPDGEVRGYVLYSGDEQVRLHDIAATDAGVARRLLRALQRRSRVIVSINEPSDSTLTAAFAATGFSEADRQYDLAVQL
ncbi:MAG TPA: GNAT family N-acetyltransferase [Roseiflexaceae bacterium]|nr:GNAT family N-acetyltransferase [Roseiflexaceae bacterium]